jgi:hypothetical protein
MKAGYICADQPVTSFFACDKAADHTFLFADHSEFGLKPKIWRATSMATVAR